MFATQAPELRCGRVGELDWFIPSPITIDHFSEKRLQFVSLPFDALKFSIQLRRRCRSQTPCMQFVPIIVYLTENDNGHLSPFLICLIEEDKFGTNRLEVSLVALFPRYYPLRHQFLPIFLSLQTRHRLLNRGSEWAGTCGRE